jgi:isopenicillin-N epimerase
MSDDRLPRPAPLKPDLQNQWLLKDGVAFLNHGSFGATPQVVFEAHEAWRCRLEAEPIELLGRQCPDLLRDVREAVGAFLGMKAHDFGLVTNATEGLNAVLRSLDLKEGDELLTTDHVYNAVRQAMRFVASRAGAVVREVKVELPVTSGDEIFEQVMAGVNERTRLVVIDHVTSPTALVFPVRRIIEACAERGVEVLVDGAHAPGMLELNVESLGAAYYAGNLHKWVCAPKGSAFIWVDPQRQAGVHPAVVSHFWGQGFELEFEWQGTRDIGAWLATVEAIRFMERIGWGRVRQHNHEMAVWAQQFLCERWDVAPLSPLDGSLLGSMATVPAPGKLATADKDAVEALQQRLYNEFAVEAPLVQWNGRVYVRASCQVYNTADDIVRLADAVAALSANPM